MLHQYATYLRRVALASSRAVLLGLLWPDPCDPCCPVEFKEQARKRLPDAAISPGTTDEDLRKALLKFIGTFADWDLSVNRTYLEVSRALVKAAHGDEPPLVVDPFAGGGSIPLEALRLGCEAFASDLNPVACLILKVMLEDVPRHGSDLADELRRVGAQIKAEAVRELADFYPKDIDGRTPIAYLWARTVRCESPNCGAEIPLMRSFWLSKKANGRRALKPRVVKTVGSPPRIEFEIIEPKAERDVPSGTVTRAKATCLSCGSVLPPGRVRLQLVEQRGGADVVFDTAGHRTGGALLFAVATHKPGEQGRQYRLPHQRDYEAVSKAHYRLAQILEEWELAGKQGLSPVPDEALPLMSGTFNVPLYGMNSWGDLFTSRQKATLLGLGRIVEKLELVGHVRDIVGLALSRLTDIYNDVCIWEPTKTQVRHLFANQAIPMRWDFPEASAIAEQAGDFQTTLETMVRVVERLSSSYLQGTTQLADANESPLPDNSAQVWFTDPPYYFAVPYADLSDFFFVWLKRVLPGHPLLRDPFSPQNPLTPKDRELCEMAHWDPDRYARKDQKFFEDGMAKAFTEGRRVLRADGIGTVVFAHKTTEGWEALLTGMIRGGWTITGSWPIATELANRPRALESAALATSVHLVCRPRPDDAGVGDWAAVLRELPPRVSDWIERLQGEGVRGADLVFACIGPALEVFSRYTSVESADGREVTLVLHGVNRLHIGEASGMMGEWPITLSLPPSSLMNSGPL
jgi:adenine-specific DNA methylase